MLRPGSHRLLLAMSACLVLAGSALAAATGQDDQAPRAQPKLPFQIRPVSAAQRPPSATTDDHPVPLAPPRRGATATPTRSRGGSPASALGTVISSVAVVLGCFALLVWFTRRTRPRGYATLPGNVLETLGRAPLNGRQEMHLVRVGNKLLLLSVTATAAETLTEITDPEEIDRLSEICRQPPSDRMAASFREMLSHLSHRQSTTC
jgi:flagellar biogenesis protein FliO